MLCDLPCSGDINYPCWLKRKQMHAAKLGANASEDRSEWTLEQWQAWDQQSHKPVAVDRS